MQLDPAYREAFLQWRRDTFAWNRRTEELRKRGEERDRQHMTDTARLRASARARGFTGADNLVRPF
jgi:hypothetical protein